jgi:hypothetical protein
MVDAGGFVLAHASGATLALATTAGERSVELAAAYSPAYGRVERASVLRTSLAASGFAVIAAFVPVQAARRRCPRLALVGTHDVDAGAWTASTFTCDGDAGDRQFTVAFPRNLEAPARPQDWPQPCIQDLRASCVE